MNKPKLTKHISLDNFNDFYWLKTELITFCRSLGISTSGGKIEIAERIRYYIKTGKIIKKPAGNKKQSKFNWSQEVLTKETIITDNYKNGRNVRGFFIREIGSHFSFNVIFIKWIRENAGKTLKDAIDEWEKINEIKKVKGYESTIDPQFEYNRYIRAFLKDNPDLSGKDARKFWKLKKEKRGNNDYERDDLKLK